MKLNLLSKRFRARRVLCFLSVSVAVLIALHLVLQFLNFIVFGQQNGLVFELSNRFDLDDEISVPTWVSQLLLFMGGVLALIAALLQNDKSARNVWGVLSGLLLLFSLDEIAGLHEFVLQVVHVWFFQDAAPTVLANAWLVALPLSLILSIVLAGSMMRVLPRRTLIIFLISGSAFLLGAAGLDLLTIAVDRETFMQQGLMVALEEGLELFSVAFVIYGTYDYLERHKRTKLRLGLINLAARL